MKIVHPYMMTCCDSLQKVIMENQLVLIEGTQLLLWGPSFRERGGILFCLSFNLISSWFILKPKQSSRLVLTSLGEFKPPANLCLQVHLENKNFVLEFLFLVLQWR